jgi:hypothetical protein
LKITPVFQPKLGSIGVINSAIDWLLVLITEVMTPMPFV